MYIYIYIYIVIHRQICFVLSELISVARQYLPVAGIETWLTQTPSQSFLPFSHEETLNFKRLWITITIVYIHPFKYIYIYIYIVYSQMIGRKPRGIVSYVLD